MGRLKRTLLRCLVFLPYLACTSFILVESSFDSYTSSLQTTFFSSLFGISTNEDPDGLTTKPLTGFDVVPAYPMDALYREETFEIGSRDGYLDWLVNKSVGISPSDPYTIGDSFLGRIAILNYFDVGGGEPGVRVSMPGDFSSGYVRRYYTSISEGQKEEVYRTYVAGESKYMRMNLMPKLNEGIDFEELQEIVDKARITVNGTEYRLRPIDESLAKLGIGADSYYVGTTIPVYPVFTPDDAYDQEYRVECDEEHLSFEDGYVTFLKAGTTTATFIAHFDENLRKSITFEVKDRPMTDVDILDGDIEIEAGEIRSLDYECMPRISYPNGSLVFSSSDERIVEIDKDIGVLRAISHGTATISVTYKDNPTVSDSISVTVSNGVSSTNVNATQNTPLSFDTSAFEVLEVLEEHNDPTGTDFSVLTPGTTFRPKVVGAGDVYLATDNKYALEIGDDGTVKALQAGTKARLYAYDASDMSNHVYMDLRIAPSTCPFEVDTEVFTPKSIEAIKDDEGNILYYDCRLVYAVHYELAIHPLGYSTGRTFTHSCEDYLGNDVGNSKLSFWTKTRFSTRRAGTQWLKLTYGDEESFRTFSIYLKLEIELPSLSDELNSDQAFLLFRKGIGHIGLFMFTSLLAAFGIFVVFRKLRNRLFAILASLGLGVCTSLLSEFIQLNTPGRSFAWTDVLIDVTGYLLGVLLAVLVAVIWAVIVNKKKKKQEKDEAGNG